MPAPVVSPTLFNAHALAATVNEPHVRAGNHLRISSHPKLGLPVAPFLIWRAVVDNMKGMQLRHDVVFKDSKDKTLAPPFTLNPNNPVTAYIRLQPGETCYWAEVMADPAGSPSDSRVHPRRPRRRFPPLRRQPVRFPVLTRPIRLEPVPGSLIGSIITQPAPRGMEAEAYVSSAYGTTSVGKRNTPRFAFHAPGLVKIELRGSGTVTGVRWLEMHDVQRLKFEPWRLLNLPHKGGPRYISIENAKAVAKQRVHRQAPKRQPLQETASVLPPASLPLANAAFEDDRVASLSADLEQHLDSLIMDLSEPQREQSQSSEIFDEHNKKVGEFKLNRLAQIMQSLADPGVASYLGFKAYDSQFVEQEQRIIFYWVEGFFQYSFQNVEKNKEDRVFNALFNTLQPGNRLNGQKDLINAFHDINKKIKDVVISKDTLRSFVAEAPLYRFGTLAVAERDTPLLPPSSPHIDSIQHVGWIPAKAPQAVREVTTNVSRVNVNGLLAAKKKTPVVSGAIQNLHAKNRDGFHLPIVLGLNADDEEETRNPEPGQGFISDRAASNDPIRYYVAQQDRFGRWSQWVAGIIQPAERPRPPRPVFQAYYRMPEIADPGLAGKAPAGKVRVIVQVPEIDALAPASYLLSHFRLNSADPVAATTALIEKNVASPPPQKLDFKYDAPRLLPTEERKLELTAYWKDTQGQISEPSEKVILTLRDPRPPAQITVPNTLQYASRPDVTGLSVVEYEWTATAEQSHFAIYYTDENRLNDYLQQEAARGNVAATSALQALENAGTALQAHDRAAIYRTNANLFGRHLWERLDDVNVDLPGNQHGFRHTVSGSLRILNFYRIAAESETGVGPEFSQLPLLAYGVPNTDPPAKPLLSVQLMEMESNSAGYRVQLDIRLLKGSVRVERFRIRRSSLGIVDTLRTPVVATDLMDTELEEDEHHHTETAEEAKYQHGHLIDSGPVMISPTAKLLPWVRYFWVAEVQGAPEPGSTLPGKWSQASDPVNLLLVPAYPPGAASNVQVTGNEVASGVFESLELSFDHAEVLSGGLMGHYVVRVLRQQGEQAMQLVDEIPVTQEAPHRFSISDPGEQFSPDVRHQVVIIDPLGRESGSVEVSLITPR